MSLLTFAVSHNSDGCWMSSYTSLIDLRKMPDRLNRILYQFNVPTGSKFGLIAFMSAFYGLSLILLYGSDGAWWERLILLVIATVIFWAVTFPFLFGSNFIVAGDAMGIIYQTRADKNVFLAVPWNHIEKIQVSLNSVAGGRAKCSNGFTRWGNEGVLEIWTTIPDDIAIRWAPRHGCYCAWEGRWIFCFGAPETLFSVDNPATELSTLLRQHQHSVK